MATSLQTRRVLPLPEAPIARPLTVPSLYRAAARILASNGLHKGDFVPDVFDREMTIPHFARPMSIVAALKCAATGDPHRTSLLADEAISVLALRLEVDGEGPLFGGIFDLEAHVDAWGDVESRSTESAVAVLEAAGDANDSDGICGADLGPGYTCQRSAGHGGDCEPTPDPAQSGGAS